MFSSFIVVCAFVALLCSLCSASDVNRAIMNNFFYLSSFPMGTKSDNAVTISNLRGSSSEAAIDSLNRGYISMNVYSDNFCTSLALSSTMQMDKCYLAGYVNGTAQYTYNTYMISDDMYTVSQYVFNGKCKKNGSFNTPTSVVTMTYPVTMNCSPLGNNLYGMAIFTYMLPVYPLVEGFLAKQFDPRSGECVHAEKAFWIQSGFCYGPYSDYSVRYDCYGNGGKKSYVNFFEYSTSDCSGSPVYTFNNSTKKGLCYQAPFDDDLVQSDDSVGYQYLSYVCTDGMH